MSFKLLTKNNTKTMKGQSVGFMTFVLHLAPHTRSGVGNVCPKATAGCIAACLNTAGYGGMFKPGTSTNVVQEARIRKTKLFFQDRDAFMKMLAEDISKAITYATSRGLIPVFRLNGTSDLPWEKYPVNGAKNIFELFPTVTFYDYTKVLGRKIKSIPNYHVTFSRAESNQADVEKAIKAGMNVAVVFDQLPATYLDRMVVDGDVNDTRFNDPRNVVVGLKAKGRAKKDTTNFVVRVDTQVTNQA